jgi:hypothetical protein
MLWSNHGEAARYVSNLVTDTCGLWTPWLGKQHHFTHPRRPCLDDVQQIQALMVMLPLHQYLCGPRSRPAHMHQWGAAHKQAAHQHAPPSITQRMRKAPQAKNLPGSKGGTRTKDAAEAMQERPWLEQDGCIVGLEKEVGGHEPEQAPMVLDIRAKGSSHTACVVQYVPARESRSSRMMQFVPSCSRKIGACTYIHSCPRSRGPHRTTLMRSLQHKESACRKQSRSPVATRAPAFIWRALPLLLRRSRKLCLRTSARVLKHGCTLLGYQPAACWLSSLIRRPDRPVVGWAPSALGSICSHHQSFQ